MDTISNLIKPDSIVFVVTHKCTASCKNCCFGCSPKKKQKLSLTEVKGYLDQALDSYGDSIRIAVFTGGEAFLLGNDINSMIEYAHRKKLRTRIVTNGYWANSLVQAKTRISVLRELGLDEINFSTGDEHIQWVPITHIYNGVVASMDAGLVTAVNIESHDNTTINVNSFIADLKLEQYLDRERYQNPLKVIGGVWVPFKRDEKIVYSPSPLGVNRSKCQSIFSTVAINPYSVMMACCGLPSEQMLTMRLGNVKDNPIPVLYEQMFSDLFKLWLYVDGPYKILDYIQKGRGISKPITGHICQICAEIQKDEGNIDFITAHYDSILHRVVSKLALINNSYENRND